MAMYGADVQELRQLAVALDDASRQLDQDRALFAEKIRVAAWLGPWAVSFQFDWDNDHTRRISDAAHALQQAAAKVRSNADAQESASGVGHTPTSARHDVGTGLNVAAGSHGGVSEARNIIDDIHNGDLVPGVKGWDALSIIDAGRSIPGFDRASAFMDGFESVDKLMSGTYGFGDFYDDTASFLKSGPTPVQKLLGANMAVWKIAGEEIQKTDFSSGATTQTLNYAASNPGVVLEEFGKAVIRVLPQAW